MHKEKITIDTIMPNGYTATGEVRQATEGEYYTRLNGELITSDCTTKEPVIILKKAHTEPELFFLFDSNGKWISREGKLNNYKSVKNTFGRVTIMGVEYEIMVCYETVVAGYYNDGLEN